MANLKLCLLLVATAACLFLSGCSGVSVKDTTRTFNTVVIDPGHGGRDSGARSRAGLLEKTAALDVARHLDTELREAGFRTVMTRDRDVFVELNDRARISNRQENAIFVSVHFNSTSRRRTQGVETHYKSRVSRGLASHIVRDLASYTGTPNRGAKTANFRVLRMNRYPAVLVECGFLTNRREAGRCASAAYRRGLAKRIAGAIVSERGCR